MGYLVSFVDVNDELYWFNSSGSTSGDTTHNLPINAWTKIASNVKQAVMAREDYNYTVSGFIDKDGALKIFFNTTMYTHTPITVETSGVVQADSGEEAVLYYVKSNGELWAYNAYVNAKVLVDTDVVKVSCTGYSVGYLKKNGSVKFGAISTASGSSNRNAAAYIVPGAWLVIAGPVQSFGVGGDNNSNRSYGYVLRDDPSKFYFAHMGTSASAPTAGSFVAHTPNKPILRIEGWGGMDSAQSLANIVYLTTDNELRTIANTLIATNVEDYWNNISPNSATAGQVVLYKKFNDTTFYRYGSASAGVTKVPPTGVKSLPESGGWAYNAAPNTPPTNNPKGTQTTPSILVTNTPTLDWSFNDPDVGDTQSKYQVRIKKASDASIIHDTGIVTSALTDYTVPAGVIVKNELYYWEVQTYDVAGVVSAWSSPEYFKLTDQAAAGDVFTFNYTGATQPFTVPGNVKRIKMEAWGAQGGTCGRSGNLATGGKGGYAKGEVSTTGGQILNVYVGGKGANSPTATAHGGAGGWNGGGNGGSTSTTSYGGGGGGGASDIRTGTTLESRVLVAAGGGGGSSTIEAYSGGDGGGLTGGARTNVTGYGAGGTQTAGGGMRGSLGVGGDGSNLSAGAGTGGGGGGYYGGGGGSASPGPGGGGSSYIGTLDSGETLAGQRSGDGLVMITVLEVSNPPTVVNRDPGTTDQTAPEGSNMAPLFAWDYSGAFVQSKYQIKIFNPDGSLAHDTGQITSTAKQHQLASGILQGGTIYGWELTVTDDKNISYPTNRLYFITNRPPSAVIPENPIDNYRTGLRPTFWATIGDDVENDPQKFVIQIAEDSNFTVNVQERNSETSPGGWQVKTVAGTYGDLPAGGVDATYEGGTVKYTWSAELTEGKTYYWRMAGIDATTGARGAWSKARRIRVGNKIDVSLKQPVNTSAAIQRLLIRAQYALATDGTNPATVRFEACNNGFDENPTWEDVTAAVQSGEYHNFANTQKTATDWGFNIRAIFEANDSLDPIEFYGFGISFD